MKQPARLNDLYPHQKAALTNITRHFVTRRRARGQFISACGSGKTMVMSMLPFTLDAQTTTFMVPNLNLIGQTWRAFQQMTGDGWFDGFIVCSDDTLHDGGRSTASDQDTLVDDQTEDEIAAEFHGRVLREPSEIAEAIDSRGGRPLVIFSTYQSSHLLLAGVLASQAGKLDLMLADEAHHLVSGSDNGASAEKPGSQQRNVLIDMPVTRRLFATATPKAVKSIRKRLIFSMDNKAQFGGEAHVYNYARAVHDRVVSPIEIVICQVDPDREEEFLDAARYALPEGDTRRQIRATGVVSHDDIRSLSVANGVSALLRQGRVSSMLTYSHRIKRAEHNAADINIGLCQVL